MKASTKKEIYNFFTLECEAYLPKIDTINVHFLKQIVRAQKDVNLDANDILVHQEISSQGGSCAID
jgi:hypothetical protein